MSSERSEQVAEYIRNLDLTGLHLWRDLDSLSTHTYLDGVEIDPDGIIVSENGDFTGVFNVYVTLQYGHDEEEGFSTSDSFLATVRGHFNDGAPVIDDSSVDTSSFYGEEEAQAER